MDSILAFFTNESFAVVAGLVVGVIYKFVPALRNLSNQMIPLLTAATAFLVHALGPAEAHAGILSGVAGTFGGIFLPVVRATVDSIVAKWVNEHMLRGALDAAGWRKPIPTK